MRSGCCVHGESGEPLAFQAQALVAQYDLDEVVGPVAHDSSSNVQDGQFTLGVQLGLTGASPATGRAARFNPALGSHARIDAPAGLAYLRSNVNVTAWVRPESDAGIMPLFANADSGWSCARTPDGLRFSVRFVQEFVRVCEVPLDRWSHVAFVLDGGFNLTQGIQIRFVL